MNYMKVFILTSCTYIVETIAELILICSFLGKKRRDLLSVALLLLPVCGIINNLLSIFIPNVFGWFLTFPIMLFSYSLILHISISTSVFPFMFSYVTYGLIEAITIILLPCLHLCFFKYHKRFNLNMHYWRNLYFYLFTTTEPITYFYQ